MTITAVQARQGVTKEMGRYISGTTTSDGNAGGTTTIDTSLMDYPDSDYRIKDCWELITSGDYDGEERPTTGFATATGTTTVRRAYSGKIVSGVTHEIHQFKPSMIIEKLNKAIYGTTRLFQEVRDSTQETADATYQYDVLATIIGEPLQIWIEVNTEDADYPYRRLWDWRYDNKNHSVYFDYALPVTRTLLMIGKGYMTALSTSLDTTTATASTTECSGDQRPDARHLYCLAAAYLIDDLAMQAKGSERDALNKQRNEFMGKAEFYGSNSKRGIPYPTQKRKGWTYGGRNLGW